MSYLLEWLGNTFPLPNSTVNTSLNGRFIEILFDLSDALTGTLMLFLKFQLNSFPTTKFLLAIIGETFLPSKILNFQRE